MSTSLDDIKLGLSAQARIEVEARVQELRAEISGLQPLRKALGLTQLTLARRMKTSQAGVAKMEQRADLLLSTLRHYIEGLGGELELVARFPGRPDVRIAAIGDIPVDPANATHDQ